MNNIQLAYIYGETFACQYDEKVFPSLSGLRRHTEIFHRDICPICGEKPRNMKIHALQKGKKDLQHAIFYFLLQSERFAKKSIRAYNVWKAGEIAYMSKYVRIGGKYELCEGKTV